MERENGFSIHREVDPIEQLTHYSPEQMAWEKVVNLPADLHDFVNEGIRFGFYTLNKVIKLPFDTIREHKQRVSTGVHEFGHWFAVKYLGGIPLDITALPNYSARSLGMTRFSLANVGDTVSMLRKRMVIGLSGVAGAVVGGTDTGGGGSDQAQVWRDANLLAMMKGGDPASYRRQAQSLASGLMSSIGSERLRYSSYRLVAREAA